jgi:hypothetical protein
VYAQSSTGNPKYSPIDIAGMEIDFASYSFASSKMFTRQAIIRS